MAVLPATIITSLQRNKTNSILSKSFLRQTPSPNRRGSGTVPWSIPRHLIRIVVLPLLVGGTTPQAPHLHRTGDTPNNTGEPRLTTHTRITPMVLVHSSTIVPRTHPPPHPHGLHPHPHPHARLPPAPDMRHPSTAANPTTDPNLPPSAAKSTTPAPAPAPAPPAGRKGRACLACRKLKMRCVAPNEEGGPDERCQRCERAGLECVYVDRKRRGPGGVFTGQEGPNGNGTYKDSTPGFAGPENQTPVFDDGRSAKKLKTEGSPKKTK
ncbi:fungal zn(2)-Cys(6) binuclear cluster domain-containing protein [Rhizoctonia solani AG-1 IA]|uniref:Fungal zn(2)-Cys(6) binuclear cluster domain-containing protein n=1 Tax=Thanatephorus cucumeris (strain AG1-IA) TaxID=983506 RepID=L8WDL5_THACA|nr:fungal zn(2)-Cys(6) binuclear cluster domain-containing protein [Rhizoctonia solani AG-1 IA]